MAYHKWPAGNSGDVIYNWDAMLAGNPVELASFIAYLGSDRYAGHTQPGMTTSYGCDGSNTTYGNHFDFLGQNNYTYKGTYSYDYNTVCWSIDTNCPLYARGEDGKDGHAWVIDGYVSLASKSKSCVLTACFNYEGYFIGYDGGPHSCVTKEFPNENKYYVHCNWGWNGSCNGYFLSGVFDADQVKLPSDYPDNLTRGYVFDSGLKLSPSIKPNR